MHVAGPSKGSKCSSSCTELTRPSAGATTTPRCVGTRRSGSRKNASSASVSKTMITASHQRFHTKDGTASMMPMARIASHSLRASRLSMSKRGFWGLGSENSMATSIAKRPGSTHKKRCDLSRFCRELSHAPWGARFNITTPRRRGRLFHAATNGLHLRLHCGRAIEPLHPAGIFHAKCFTPWKIARLCIPRFIGHRQPCRPIRRPGRARRSRQTGRPPRSRGFATWRSSCRSPGFARRGWH